MTSLLTTCAIVLFCSSVVFHDVVAIANGTWSPETLDYLQELLHYDHPGRDVIVKVKVVGDSRQMPLMAAVEIQSEHNGREELDV